MAEGFGLLTWEDVERVVHSRATNLAEVVLKFLRQPGSAAPRELPDDALTEDRLKKALEKLKKEARHPSEKRSERESLFSKWTSQKDPAPPERLKLAELLLDLDKPKEPLARQALLALAREVPLIWGPWSALKKLYKAAE